MFAADPMSDFYNLGEDEWGNPLISKLDQRNLAQIQYEKKRKHQMYSKEELAYESA